jgi:Tol biopolymer transport system component
MVNCRGLKWLKIRTLIFCLLMVGLASTMGAAKSNKKDKRGKEVRAELASLQKETGLSLAYFAWYVGTLDFAHRDKLLSDQKLDGPPAYSQNGDISPHGTKVAFAWSYYVDALGKRSIGSLRQGERLAIVQTEGTGLREFPAITGPKYFCWSPDESKLAVYTFVRNGTKKEGKLLVLDLGSNQAEQIAIGPAFLTPQCWSPDGQTLVYGISELGDESILTGKIVIYSLAEKSTKILGPGAYPTWSADGNWIAFLEGDDYYIVSPSGHDKKLFLHTIKPRTGLLWSPDGRFVAYGLCCKYRWMDPDTYWRFYVRRLRDNAEDWVADFGDFPVGSDVHWVQPLKPEKSEASGSSLSPWSLRSYSNVL